ncbi:unnamed protein product [Closterium sp. NIES-65]|nr:unnamed protein product [Closterium sp. NIES-65]
MDKLKLIPESFQQLTGLRSFSLQSKRVRRVPEHVVGAMVRLKSLSLSCKSIQSLPDAICSLPLSSLSILSSPVIASLPENLGALVLLETLKLCNLPNLQYLPESVGDLQQLRLLEISQLGLLQLPEELCTGSVRHSLEGLYLRDCSGLRQLPAQLAMLTRLEELEITSCSRLESLEPLLAPPLGHSTEQPTAQQSWGLASLTSLSLCRCSRIPSLPDSFSTLSALSSLTLTHMHGLSNLPESLGQLENLRILKLQYLDKLSVLPESLGQLKELETLELCYLPELNSLPGSLRWLPKLKEPLLIDVGRIADLPVYGVAIPTVEGIRNVLQIVGASRNGGRHVLWHSMREEPVIYINGRPFVLREVERPFTNLEYTGINRARVEQMEARLKKDVLREAGRYSNKIMVSDELPDGQMVDQWEPVGPDSVQTPLEVYEDLQRQGYNVDYERVPVTDEKVPEEVDFDLLVSLQPSAEDVISCKRDLVVSFVIHFVSAYLSLVLPTCLPPSLSLCTSSSLLHPIPPHTLSLLPPPPTSLHSPLPVRSLSVRVAGGESEWGGRGDGTDLQLPDGAGPHHHWHCRRHPHLPRSPLPLPSVAMPCRILSPSAGASMLAKAASTAGHEPGGAAKLMLGTTTPGKAHGGAEGAAAAAEAAEVQAGVERVLLAGQYAVIRSLTRVLEAGSESKRLTDLAIDHCASMQVTCCRGKGRDTTGVGRRKRHVSPTHSLPFFSLRLHFQCHYSLIPPLLPRSLQNPPQNLREAILGYRNRIHRHSDEKRRQAALNLFVAYLERYYMLVCFSAFLHSLTAPSASTPSSITTSQALPSPSLSHSKADDTHSAHVRAQEPHTPSKERFSLLDGLAATQALRDAKGGFQRWMKARPELYSILRRDPMGALGYAHPKQASMPRGLSFSLPHAVSSSPTRDATTAVAALHAPAPTGAASLPAVAAAGQGEGMEVEGAEVEAGDVAGEAFRMAEMAAAIVEARSGAMLSKQVHLAMRQCQRYIRSSATVFAPIYSFPFSSIKVVKCTCTHHSLPFPPPPLSCPSHIHLLPLSPLSPLSSPSLSLSLSLSPSLPLRPSHSLHATQTVLKSDHCPGCQNLSLPELLEGAPNFRQVHGLPVFGVANPTIDGIRAVLRRVAHAAGKGSGGAEGVERRVVWHNMREEATVYVNGKPFVLREAERPFKNMLEYTGIDRQRVERMEARLKGDVEREAQRSGGIVVVDHESDAGELFHALEPVPAAAHGAHGACVQTPLEVFRMLQREGFRVDYHRLPTTDGQPPKSRDFDALATTISSAGPHAAFVFNCQVP